MKDTDNTMTRRAAIGAMAGAATMAGVLTGANSTAAAQAPAAAPAGGGRIKQAASRWCYSKVELPDLCAKCKEIGIKGLDLLDEEDWKAVIDAGLEVSMANGPSGISDGWVIAKNHKQLIERSNEIIPKLGALGIKNMILLSGNRKGMSDEEGLKNAAAGIKEIIPVAKKHNVMLIMELLNSKKDHKDYMCDHTVWGVKLADMLGTDNFKLLYDVYHMQIMEGDIITTIRQYSSYIGHYHTGGVPGRNEIDQTQELNYRRICEAIAETGFTGFLAHEFTPARDPLTSLQEAYNICNV